MKTIEDLVKQALAEDLGDGDHSGLSCISSDAVGKAKLLVKDDGIIAGLEVAKMLSRLNESHCQF